MAAVAFLPLMAMVLGHFYSCMVALVLGAALLLNEATEAIGRRRWTSSLTVAAVGNALLVGWSLWTLARIMPPPDMTFNRPPVLAFYPGRVLSALCIPWRGLVPVPCVIAGRAFWGTNVLGLEALPQRLVGALAGTFLLLGLGGCFVRKCTSLVVFGGGVLGLMSFAYVKGLYTSLGTVRQHGYAFLLLLLAFWLREVLPQTDLLRAVSSYVPERLSAAWQSLEQRLFAGTRLLTVILAINAGCGLHAWAMDMVLPFCNTRSVAALLKPRLDRQTLVVGDKDLWTCAIAAHLDTEIYYPKGKRRGTFLVWNRDREAPVALPELVQDTNAAIERGLKVFLVLSYALDPDALGSAGARFRVHLLQSCPTPIIGQRLWVYEATPAVDDDSSPGGTPGAPPAG